MLKGKHSMHTYLYKIINIINNKEYIGIHTTDNPYDSYMGSGRLIKSAIKKYGIENFTKEIIQQFDDRYDALLAEKHIVNEQYILSDNTYNITIGGNSPPDMSGVPRSDDTKRKISSTRRSNHIYPTAGIAASIVANTGREPPNKGTKANVQSIEKRTATRRLIKLLFSQCKYDDLLSLPLKPSGKKRIRDKINMITGGTHRLSYDVQPKE